MFSKNLYNSPDVVILIKERAKATNITIKDMLSSVGLGVNTLSHMNHGKAIAFDSLARIADYLDCSVDYLLGRTDDPALNSIPAGLTGAEAGLVSDYRRLDAAGQEYIRQTMAMALHSYSEKKDAVSTLEEPG